MGSAKWGSRGLPPGVSLSEPSHVSSEPGADSTLGFYTRRTRRPPTWLLGVSLQAVNLDISATVRSFSAGLVIQVPIPLLASGGNVDIDPRNNIPWFGLNSNVSMSNGLSHWGITPQFGGLGWRDFGCDLFSSGVEAGLPGECADLISDVVMSGKNGSFGAAVGVPREGVKLDCACYPAT